MNVKNGFYCSLFHLYSYFMDASEQLNIHDYELMKIFFYKNIFY